MRFAKGHGTGNDFVVLPDFDGTATHPLTTQLVQALCDRRAGVGADGVLRVVRTAAADLSAEETAAVGAAEWFMDYRNADGSAAEMCGNGIRVYARYLVDHGLAEPGQLALATRAGLRQVVIPRSGEITVDMGAPQLPTWPPVKVTAASRSYEGTQVSMGNPHVVCQVGRLGDVGSLLDPPQVVPASAFPDGVNVEFVARQGPGRLSMRVHERGVGETQSCGTGACAAAVAACLWDDQTAGAFDVTVPGGELGVRWVDGTVLLTGPAVIVGEGELDATWVAWACDAAGDDGPTRD